MDEHIASVASSFNSINENSQNDVQHEYRGTCTFSRDDTPGKNEVKDLMIQVMHGKQAIAAAPYDPLSWLCLASNYHKLLYPDLSVSASHRAMKLINAGLNITNPKEHLGGPLAQRVRSTVARRLLASHPYSILEDLQDLRLQCHHALIVGLLYCNAHWEGLRAVNEAVEIWPGDKDFARYKEEIKTALEERMRAVQDLKCSDRVKRKRARTGNVLKKQYPWMAEKLFARTSELLESINKDAQQTMVTENCEVRPMVFTDRSKSGRSDGDVGQLGVFATRDIQAGEVVLQDLGISMMCNLSPINPDKKHHCDACQGLLLDQEFYILKGGIHPDCCKDVKYCGIRCFEASRRYHRVLCKQDFSWLYQTTTGKRHNESWFPILLLRVFAIILGDMRHRPAKDGPAIKHPLDHPLVARLTAGYPVQNPNSNPQIWTYFQQVEAPARILTQLGVDIFGCSDWSPEVIHTIYWRVANNSCVSSTTTTGYWYDDFSAFKKIDVFGISPNYVFFNHSCDPSVEWTSSGQGMYMGKSRPVFHVEDGYENIGRAMVCRAIRPIKNGEEARIAYIPARAVNKGDLAKWFDGGCGCNVCAGAISDSVPDSHSD